MTNLAMTHIASARLATLLLFTATAFAQRQSFGDVSFPVPNGYQFEFVPGDDHATVGMKNGNAFSIFVIYRPIRSTGDAEGDFKAAWPALLGKSAGPALPTPIYDLRTENGYPGKQSGSPGINRQHYLWLFVLETGREFIPVVLMTTGRPMFDSQQAAIKQMVEGIRQGSGTVGKTAAVKPEPVKAAPAGAKTSITLGDLTGEWRFGGALYIIAADGRYEYRFTGLSGTSTVREKSVGVLELGGEFVVFRDTPGPHQRRYRFISFQAASGGGTVLTLLAAEHAVNGSNITLYGEKWLRGR